VASAGPTPTGLFMVVREGSFLSFVIVFLSLFFSFFLVFFLAPGPPLNFFCARLLLFARVPLPMGLVRFPYLQQGVIVIRVSSWFHPPYAMIDDPQSRPHPSFFFLPWSPGTPRFRNFSACALSNIPFPPDLIHCVRVKYGFSLRV